MDFSKIYEGWRNNLIPPKELKDQIASVGTFRMDICRGCSENSINKKEHSLRMDEHCTNCGCTLSAKTKCLSCRCPLNKWLEVATEKQDEQLKEIYGK